LHLLFPQARAIAIAPARITQDQQFVGRRKVLTAKRTPPVSDHLDGKLRGIGGLADIDVAPVMSEIANAIRHGFAQRVLLKIMFVDGVGGLTPAPAGVLEVADQLFFLGVHANHGQSRLEKGLFLLLEIAKLRLSVGRRLTRQAFDVDVQRIVQPA